MQPGHGQHIAVNPVAQCIGAVPTLMLKTKALIQRNRPRVIGKHSQLNTQHMCPLICVIDQGRHQRAAHALTLCLWGNPHRQSHRMAAPHMQANAVQACTGDQLALPFCDQLHALVCRCLRQALAPACFAGVGQLQQIASGSPISCVMAAAS